MKTEIITFSPTGGTLKCATVLAQITPSLKSQETDHTRNLDQE